MSPDIKRKRIVIRNGKSLCAILLGNTNHQPICRLYFNKAQKRMDMLNEQKVEERVASESISDILVHADQIKAKVRRYEAQRSATPTE